MTGAGLPRRQKRRIKGESREGGREGGRHLVCAGEAYAPCCACERRMSHGVSLISINIYLIRFILHCLKFLLRPIVVEP